MSSTLPKLSDREVEFVVTASEAWTNTALAARLGVSTTAIAAVRGRRSKRALRVARRLGMLGPPPSMLKPITGKANRAELAAEGWVA